MSATLVAMDDEKPQPDERNAEVRRNPADHLAQFRFRPGKPGGPGRPPLLPEERARRQEVMSLREQIKQLAPDAIRRLQELAHGDNDFIAAKAAQFLAEKGLEIEAEEKVIRPASRLTVDSGKVEEAQRLLTEGESNAEED